MWVTVVPGGGAMPVRYRWARYAKKTAQSADDEGLHYDASFLKSADRTEILNWLRQLKPIWENRFADGRPPPEGQVQRRLLRPVYWLGSWQFACLDYYRPPHGVLNRAVLAEPYPAVLGRLVNEIEGLTRSLFNPRDIPPEWALTTCLVNLYGKSRGPEGWVDTARVGEHRDFEPGPVASLSLGERALFQFVSSKRPGERDGVVKQQWLDDGSLQIFGGDRWKKRTFHRVQRVDTRDKHQFAVDVADFETRRVNFTFRFVPREHVVRFRDLPQQQRADVQGYMKTLALSSPFFAGELADEPRDS